MNSRVRTWAQRRSERFAEPVLQTSSLSVEAMLAVPAFEWDLQILATDPQVGRRAMDLLRTTIRRHGLASALGLRDPEPVYIAHEIYHHLDQAAAVPVARRSLVVSFAFGPLRLRSGLVSLAEIGAAAFASEMTGLRCHPRLLDRLAHHALIDCPAGSSEMPCKSDA